MTTCSTPGSPPALWPFSTQGWPEQRPELERYYPTDVLVTGFDIIFFWVARMLMFGLKFMGEVPFRQVYLHGLILDADGQKMSKSKGNVIDPLDIIDGIDLEALVAKRTAGLMQPHLAAAIERATRKQYPDGIAAYGTDALRFTFASFATQSRESSFRPGPRRRLSQFLQQAVERGALRDAGGGGDSVACGHCRDAAPRAPGHAAAPSPGSAAIDVANRWIRSRLGATISAVERAFDDYRFDFAASALYEFTWHEYCDWYIEIVKPVLQDAQRSGRAAVPHAAPCWRCWRRCCARCIR